MSIEHADFDGIERLALVLGGEIASTFDSPTDVKLGHCKLIEEVMIGEDKLIHFSGVWLSGLSLKGCGLRVFDIERVRGSERRSALPDDRGLVLMERGGHDWGGQADPTFQV